MGDKYAVGGDCSEAPVPKGNVSIHSHPTGVFPNGASSDASKPTLAADGKSDYFFFQDYDLNVIVGKEGKVKGEYGPPDANGNRQLQYDDNRSAGIFIFNRKGEPITKISQGTADDIATNKRGKNGKKYEKAKANKGQ